MSRLPDSIALGDRIAKIQEIQANLGLTELDPAAWSFLWHADEDRLLSIGRMSAGEQQGREQLVQMFTCHDLFRGVVLECMYTLLPIQKTNPANNTHRALQDPYSGPMGRAG